MRIQLESELNTYRNRIGGINAAKTPPFKDQRDISADCTQSSTYPISGDGATNEEYELEHKINLRHGLFFGGSSAHKCKLCGTIVDQRDFILHLTECALRLFQLDTENKSSEIFASQPVAALADLLQKFTNRALEIRGVTFSEKRSENDPRKSPQKEIIFDTADGDEYDVELKAHNEPESRHITIYQRDLIQLHDYLLQHYEPTMFRDFLWVPEPHPCVENMILSIADLVQSKRVAPPPWSREVVGQLKAILVEKYLHKKVHSTSVIICGCRVHYELDAKTPNCAVFTLYLEDHTLGNLLRTQLLRDESVMFASYRVPHPLENKIEVRVQVTKDSTPFGALQSALSAISNQTTSLLRTLKMQLAERRGCAVKVL